MWRNIFGWSLAQIIIMFFVLFCAGPIFGYEMIEGEPAFYLVATGDHKVGDPTATTYVYTLAFQTFVFMQLFNQINARKLGTPSDASKNLPATEEYNVFSGIFNNALFIIITIGTFAAQFAIVYLGGEFLRVAPLSLYENLFAFGLGFFMLPWTLLVKKIPSRWFSGCKLND